VTKEAILLSSISDINIIFKDNMWVICEFGTAESDGFSPYVHLFEQFVNLSNIARFEEEGS
jgi:hypothetical protein